MWYADLRQQTEQLIKKDNLHISRKVTVKKRYIQKKKTAEKTNIIYLLFRVWHFVAIMISPNTLGSENGLCQSMVYVSQWSMSKMVYVNGLCMSVRPFSLRFRSKLANFGIFADLCTARKKECSQILFHKLVVWSYYF